MADYVINGVLSGTVANGSAGDQTVASSFFRPTNIASLGARFMRCDFGVKIAIADDLSTFISVNGGYVYSNSMPNDNQYFGWPKAFLAASLHNFQLAPVVGTANQFQIWTPSGTSTYTYSSAWQWDEGWGLRDATVFYSNFGIYTPKGGGYAETRQGWYDPNVNPSGFTRAFPAANGAVAKGMSFSGTHSQFVSKMSSLGYQYIGKLGDSEWGDGENLRTGYVYISGLSLFNSDTPDGVKWNYAAKIPISGMRDYMKYYPWERRLDGVWKSLNRGGSASTSSGLFRMEGGSWQPETNTEGLDDASHNNGFRYNGGWKKSPKSGQGA